MHRPVRSFHFRHILTGLVSLIALSMLTAGQAQTPLGRDERALSEHLALQAHDRFMETWNTRNPAVWASSLNYPHVRPSSNPRFDLFLTAEDYAANTDFNQTLATGWRYSRWHSREVLQVGKDKVHIAGRWIRYNENDEPTISSLVTYVITQRDGHWGLQSRFGAGQFTDDRNVVRATTQGARAAVEAYFAAFNSHDPEQLAAAIHIPHVRIAGIDVEYWENLADFRNGTEPGRQRTWLEIRYENLQVVQASANSANVTLRYVNVGADGTELSEYEALFLVTLRNGEWKVQARSVMGP
ncbi:MAG: hypothetical protein RLZZ385_1446 [Pseudomonadota bacterium]|jgi:hypothetical protein